jgi:hypothetical protein
MHVTDSELEAGVASMGRGAATAAVELPAADAVVVSAAVSI